LAAVLLKGMTMKISPVCRRSFVFGALFVSLLLPRAHATLITPAYETQLEAWLGQGNLTFTNIFTKAHGDDSFDFHAAVDGRGATFTLMSAFDGVTTYIIGGYNPQSWRTSQSVFLDDSFNYTDTDTERTAFIYNLSTATIQRQNLIGQGAGNQGVLQTINLLGRGPVFGTYDLSVGGNLRNGSANNWSYGGMSNTADIFDGAVGTWYKDFEVTELEVYSFSPGSSAVPEAASTQALMALSLAGLLMLRRRFSRA